MGLTIYLVHRENVKYDGEYMTRKVEQIYYKSGIASGAISLAKELGVYEALWRPHRLNEGYHVEEGDIVNEIRYENTHPKKAKKLIVPLRAGLKELKLNRDKYKDMFGYERMEKLLNSYIKACVKFPESYVMVER